MYYIALTYKKGRYLQLKVLYFKEREKLKKRPTREECYKHKKGCFIPLKRIKTKCNTKQQRKSRYKQIDTDAFLHMLHSTSFGNPHRT